MAFSSHRKQFKGTLANVPVEALGELDFTIETLAKRKDFIKNKYEKVKDFYDIYITGGENGEEYYKVGINNDDDLSSEINIFKYIERDGSYLLNSRDLPKNKRQQEYTFLSEEEFKKLLQRERMNLSIDDSGVMEILETPKNNEYIVKEIEIFKSDFSRKETKNVLPYYEKARIHLREEMTKLKNGQGSKYDLGFLKRNLGSLLGDMVDSKKMLQGIRCPAKRLGDESGKFYTEVIDYTCPEHIKAILKNVKMSGELSPDSDLSHIAYDMEVAIKKIYKNNEIDDIDLEIIECYNSGYSNVGIAKEINRDEKVVRRRIDKITTKISNYFKKVSN